MFQLYEQWKGLIPILGGIYGLLLAYRVLPSHPKDPEKMELWHRKFGKMMKILCPIIIVFGVLQILGVVR
jgi:hypothetical protein